MTLAKQKPAIYFPDFQTETDDTNAISIFSEKSIRETERMLSDTHVKMGGLLGLIVNLNRTHQLRKQIS